jgi:hypothetical protein
MTKQEVALVAAVADLSKGVEVLELDALQLALVGGGGGDVVFA